MYKLDILNSFFLAQKQKTKPKINTYILNSHSQQPSCWKVPNPIIYGNVLNFYKFYIKKKVYSSAFCKRFVVFFFCWFFSCLCFFCCCCCLLVCLLACFLCTGEFKIQCWGLSCLYFFGVPRGGIVPGL